MNDTVLSNLESSSSNETSRQRKPIKWWQWLLTYPALAIAVIGSMPTLVELYKSTTIGVEYGYSNIAKQQDELWQKNFACVKKSDFHGATSAHNIIVGTIVCDTGDVLLRVQRPGDHEVFQWVSIDAIGIKTVSLLNYFIRSSVAASDLVDNRLAQNASSILCQTWLKKGLLLRRVQTSGGECVDEVINTFTGKVVQRRPAKCDSGC